MTKIGTMIWNGGRFGERAHCVLAPNPGIMALDGTNTWVLTEPGARRSIVIDPGPAVATHLDAVAAAAGEVAVVLLTHHHPDHSEAAAEFASRMACPVRAADPAYCVGGEPLVDGEVIEVEGLELHVLGTPGHTADSVCFFLPAERTLLTGDTVLGHGTTVVAHPDGVLGDYLASLDRLLTVATEQQVTALWPGHGPVSRDPLGVLEGYRAHRRDRLAQVETALGQIRADQPHLSEDEVPRVVVESVYADVDPVLWDAAELSVRAQLAYLSGR